MNKIILYFVLVVITSYFTSHSSNTYALGNCLGIFEDKAVCEAKYRIERDLKVCRENSWDACRKYLKKNTINEQYCGCVDHVRRSCMVSLGHYGYSDFSACDDGP